MELGLDFYSTQGRIYGRKYLIHRELVRFQWNGPKTSFSVSLMSRSAFQVTVNVVIFVKSSANGFEGFFPRASDMGCLSVHSTRDTV